MGGRDTPGPNPTASTTSNAARKSAHVSRRQGAVPGPKPARERSSNAHANIPSNAHAGQTGPTPSRSTSAETQPRSSTQSTTRSTTAGHGRIPSPAEMLRNHTSRSRSRSRSYASDSGGSTCGEGKCRIQDADSDDSGESQVEPRELSGCKTELLTADDLPHIPSHILRGLEDSSRSSTHSDKRGGSSCVGPARPSPAAMARPSPAAVARPPQWRDNVSATTTPRVPPDNAAFETVKGEQPGSQKQNRNHPFSQAHRGRSLSVHTGVDYLYKHGGLPGGGLPGGAVPEDFGGPTGPAGRRSSRYDKLSLQIPILDDHEDGVPVDAGTDLPTPRNRSFPVAATAPDIFDIPERLDSYMAAPQQSWRGPIGAAASNVHQTRDGSAHPSKVRSPAAKVAEDSDRRWPRGPPGAGRGRHRRHLTDSGLAYSPACQQGVPPKPRTKKQTASKLRDSTSKRRSSKQKYRYRLKHQKGMRKADKTRSSTTAEGDVELPNSRASVLKELKSDYVKQPGKSEGKPKRRHTKGGRRTRFAKKRSRKRSEAGGGNNAAEADANVKTQNGSKRHQRRNKHAAVPGGGGGERGASPKHDPSNDEQCPSTSSGSSRMSESVELNSPLTKFGRTGTSTPSLPSSNSGSNRPSPTQSEGEESSDGESDEARPEGVVRLSDSEQAMRRKANRRSLRTHSVGEDSAFGHENEHTPERYESSRSLTPSAHSVCSSPSRSRGQVGERDRHEDEDAASQSYEHYEQYQQGLRQEDGGNGAAEVPGQEGSDVGGNVGVNDRYDPRFGNTSGGEEQVPNADILRFPPYAEERIQSTITMAEEYVERWRPGRPVQQFAVDIRGNIIPSAVDIHTIPLDTAAINLRSFRAAEIWDFDGSKGVGKWQNTPALVHFPGGSVKKGGIRQCEKIIMCFDGMRVLSTVVERLESLGLLAENIGVEYFYTGTTVLFVAKSYHKKKSPKVHFDELLIQAVAESHCQEFNRLLGHQNIFRRRICSNENWHRVGTLPVSVMRLEETQQFYNVEPFLPGRYIKFNDNLSWVHPFTHNLTRPRPQMLPPESSRMERYRSRERYAQKWRIMRRTQRFSKIAQAFSHYTYQTSERGCVVVDIQGVYNYFTDVQIHTDSNGGFGLGNLGPRGIRGFVGAHYCSSICRLLGLTPIQNGLFQPGANNGGAPPVARTTSGPGQIPQDLSSPPHGVDPFNVQAPKRTLRRGEDVSYSSDYDSDQPPIRAGASLNPHDAHMLNKFMPASKVHGVRNEDPAEARAEARAEEQRRWADGYSSMPVPGDAMPGDNAPGNGGYDGRIYGRMPSPRMQSTSNQHGRMPSPAMQLPPMTMADGQMGPTKDCERYLWKEVRKGNIAYDGDPQMFTQMYKNYSHLVVARNRVSTAEPNWYPNRRMGPQGRPIVQPTSQGGERFVQANIQQFADVPFASPYGDGVSQSYQHMLHDGEMSNMELLRLLTRVWRAILKVESRGEYTDAARAADARFVLEVLTRVKPEADIQEAQFLKMLFAIAGSMGGKPSETSTMCMLTAAKAFEISRIRRIRLTDGELSVMDSLIASTTSLRIVRPGYLMTSQMAQKEYHIYMNALATVPGFRDRTIAPEDRPLPKDPEDPDQPGSAPSPERHKEPESAGNNGGEKKGKDVEHPEVSELQQPHDNVPGKPVPVKSPLPTDQPAATGQPNVNPSDADAQPRPQNVGADQANPEGAEQTIPQEQIPRATPRSYNRQEVQENALPHGYRQNVMYSNERIDPGEQMSPQRMSALMTPQERTQPAPEQVRRPEFNAFRYSASPRLRAPSSSGRRRSLFDPSHAPDAKSATLARRLSQQTSGTGMQSEVAIDNASLFIPSIMERPLIPATAPSAYGVAPAEPPPNIGTAESLLLRSTILEIIQRQENVPQHEVAMLLEGTVANPIPVGVSLEDFRRPRFVNRGRSGGQGVT